jgi:hypothetical protein
MPETWATDGDEDIGKELGSRERSEDDHEMEEVSWG